MRVVVTTQEEGIHMRVVVTTQREGVYRKQLTLEWIWTTWCRIRAKSRLNQG